MIHCAFNRYKNGEFGVLPGSTFIDNQGEELDSATILITHTGKLNIKPYDFVKVWSDDGLISKTYLVDDFTEKRLKISGGTYEYTINLMSETKILEKVQLPNRAITHPWGTDGETIYSHIEELVSFYSPRIKVWNESLGHPEYESLLKVPNSQAFRDRFSDPCADLTLSQPTLRQALTALMIQKGCIPIVKNRELSYLDLRAEPTAASFSPDLSSQRSMASDSYSNTLVSSEVGVLDDDGRVVAERVGFRDRNKAVLRQTDDLKLTLEYPIYKVRKLTLNAYVRNGRINIGIAAKNRYASGGVQINFYIGVEEDDFPTDDNVYLKIGPVPAGYDVAFDLIWVDVSAVNPPGAQWLTGTNHHIDDTAAHTTDAYGFRCYPLMHYATDYRSGITAYGTATIYRNGNEVATLDIFATDMTPPISNNGSGRSDMLLFWQGADSLEPADYSTDYTIYSVGDLRGAFGSNILILYRHDITPLCVEEGKRSLLNVDYTAMPNSFSTLEDMAEWRYNTVGYRVGGNEITGFSESYTVAKGIFGLITSSLTYTYAEAMTAYLISNFPGEETPVEKAGTGGVFGPHLERVYWTEVSTGSPVDRIVNPFTDERGGRYTQMFFDVEYTPLIERGAEYSKTRVDLKLEQLDQKQDGISSASQLEAAEYDEADRIGNDVYALHHRTADPDDILPLNSSFESHIIFKRQITADFNSYDVSYFAAEHAVLKNYFTSIQTKYRSYAYVDYENAVLRKERWKNYILIDEDEELTNTSPGITFSGGFGPSYFIDGARLYQDDFRERNLQNSYRRIGDSRYRGSVAVSPGRRMLTFSTSDFDNQSPGIYIDSGYYASSNANLRKALGGVPQAWYDDYVGDSDRVGFCAKMTALDLPLFATADASQEAYAAKINALPYVSASDFASSYWNVYHLWGSHFRKDAAETLSFTLEFEIENRSGNAEWTSAAISFSTMVQGHEEKPIGLRATPNFAGELIDAKRAYSGSAADAKGLLSWASDYVAVRWADAEALYGTQITSLTFHLLFQDGRVWDVNRFTRKGDANITYFDITNDILDGDGWFEDDDGFLWYSQS